MTQISIELILGALGTLILIAFSYILTRFDKRLGAAEAANKELLELINELKTIQVSQHEGFNERITANESEIDRHSKELTALQRQNTELLNKINENYILLQTDIKKIEISNATIVSQLTQADMTHNEIKADIKELKNR